MKVKEESEKVGLKLNIYKTKIMASGPITSWQIDGEKNENSDRVYFFGLQIYCRWWLQPPLKKSYDQPRQLIKKQRHYFANKDLSSQSYGFSHSHVWMWGLDCEESWALKNWCFWTVVLEKTLESPLEYKEIQPVYLKGNQSWICWSWSSNILTTRCEELIHWRRPWCWERLNAGGEGDNGGWDGWMASPTQWTWVWVSSRSSWWTEKLGVLQSIGSERVG